MLSLMPQNRTSFSVPEVLSIAYTPQVTAIHERSKTTHSSNGIHPTYSNWSPHKKLEEVNSSMASVNLPTSPIGVLLPICLLAVFLSCVVCVYHWQSIRERRLDLEDERKRRLRIAGDFDAGCALKAYKPINKASWCFMSILFLPLWASVFDFEFSVLDVNCLSFFCVVFM